MNSVTFEIIDRHKNRAQVKAIQAETLIESDTINIDSRRSREGFLKSIAKKTGFELADLDNIFLQHLDQLRTVEQPKTFEPLDDCPEAIKQQALEMLKHPDLFALISKDIEQAGIAGEEDLCRILYIIQTSRKLDKPLSGIVFGASASGKSYLIEQVAQMMPEEDVIHAHDITNEAFYYMEPGSLKHKIVLAGERIEDKRKRGMAEDNTKALREMLASGKLTKLLTSKDKDGQLVTRRIEQEGPIAFLESTTSTQIHDEDATRLLPLVTDESPKQTEIIISAMKNKAIGNNCQNKPDIILKHKTAQRMLKKYEITIPYAIFLNLPCNKVSTRRAFDQLLSVIKAVALLRQYQKEAQNEIIEADTIDYSIVYPLISKIFARTYSRINEKSKELLEIITDKNNSNSEFTISTLMEWTGISEPSVRRRLRELIDEGIISENKEQKPYKFKIENLDLLNFGNIELITPEDLEERIAIASY